MPIIYRRFPYFYKALLAICSDIDSMHLWQFMTVHKFLNTLTRAIPHYGEGVGLDIGDRFYFKNMSNKGVSVYDACYRCRGEEDAWVDELGGKNARSMEPANAPLDDLRGMDIIAPKLKSGFTVREFRNVKSSEIAPIRPERSA